MDGWSVIRSVIRVGRCLPLLVVTPGLVWAQADGVSREVEGDGSTEEVTFDYRERSTVDTIPFRSMAEESLSNTVIEGGLAAPAAGVPVQAEADEDFYLDPLALQPRDSRTDLGRSEIPVDIRFSNPKVIPGQTHSNNYVIRPPENRTYDTLNTNLTGR